MRNLQEQVKKASCYQKLFWPFPVWINCSSDLKKIANSWPLASNVKFFSRSLEQFFLTVCQNNFLVKKIPFLPMKIWKNSPKLAHNRPIFFSIYCQPAQISISVPLKLIPARLLYNDFAVEYLFLFEWFISLFSHWNCVSSFRNYSKWQNKTSFKITCSKF